MGEKRGNQAAPSMTRLRRQPGHPGPGPVRGDTQAIDLHLSRLCPGYASPQLVAYRKGDWPPAAAASPVAAGSGTLRMSQRGGPLSWLASKVRTGTKV